MGGSHDGPPVLGYVDWAIEVGSRAARNDQTAEEIRKLIGFLRNSAERLHYRRARQGGYPSAVGASRQPTKVSVMFG